MDENILRGITWNRKTNGVIRHGYAYGEDEIANWSGTQDDADHVNCVSVGLPTQANSATQWLGSIGLPLVARKSVDRFGLRHFNPRWPYFPPLDEQAQNAGTQAAMFASIYTVALQAMQFMGAADRFWKGAVRMATFTPELRPGMTVEFDLRDVFDPGSGRMTAYVDKVHHRVEVKENGAVTATSTVSYSRGALTDEIYTSQFQRSD